MPAALCKSDKPLFLNIFPSWNGRQPFRFFIMENLLEARRDSHFPTNGAGPDEDVNVFLTGLLTRFLAGEHDPAVVQGAACLLLPPSPSGGRRQHLEFYLANACHRLLFLGLANRGDGLRRRPVPFGFTRAESRERDMAAGATCFAMAVNLAEKRALAPGPVVDVWRKLARHFEDYVHVLGVLATRRLGLGAHLGAEELTRMSRGDVSAEAGTPRQAATPASPPASIQAKKSPADQGMDHFLDRLSQYRQGPDNRTEQNVWIAARRLGLPDQAVLNALRRT